MLREVSTRKSTTASPGSAPPEESGRISSSTIVTSVITRSAARVSRLPFESGAAL